MLVHLLATSLLPFVDRIGVLGVPEVRGSSERDGDQDLVLQVDASGI